MSEFCSLNIWDFAHKKANFHTHTVDFYRQFPIDYLILGQHYFAEEGLTPYVADALTDPKYVEEYVQAVSDALDTGLFLYQAHTDLFRFCGDQGRYWAGMQKILDILKSKNLPVEVNGNGFSFSKWYKKLDKTELLK